MTAVLLPQGKQQYFTAAGIPLVGGKVFTYDTGTTTPRTTWADAAQASPNANPVILDARGEAPIFWSGAYRVVVQDSLGNAIWTMDGVSNTGYDTDPTLRADLASTVSGSDGARLVGFRNTSANSVGRTVYSKLSDAINVRDFGVLGNNTDEHVAFQAAINAVSALGGGVLAVPKPASKYNIGTVGLSVPANVFIVGDTWEQVIYNYQGTGFAFTFVAGGNGLMNAYIETTAAAGSALSFGNDSRRSALIRVTAESTFAPASGRTGTGLSLTTTAAATTFSGNMVIDQLYLLGYKYGWDWNCFETALKTWTTVVASQLFINGPGAGVCAGSRGIRLNATTNGVGSTVFGGTLEGCEAPIEVMNGTGFGISYFGDIEGNTSNVPILGASWCGEIIVHPEGTVYRGGANLSTNRWMLERHLQGNWDREAWFGHFFTIYENGPGFAAFFDIYRGASRIAGGAPTLKWRFATGDQGADNGANRNYLKNMAGQLFTGDNNTPEGVVTAPVGSIYQRLNGGAVTSVYFKESGVGNVGWIAK